MSLLEKSPYASDEGAMIGRDPRTLTAAEFLEHFPEHPTGLKLIRAMCLSCSHTANEVRKCTVTSCPLWPLRMGTKPKGLREARGEKERPPPSPEQIAKMHEARQ